VRASIVIVGVAAVVLAGCGSIGNTAGASTGSTAKTSPSPGRGANANGVVGQVAQVASGKLTVTDRTGNVTVTYDSSTTVLQSGTGSLADVVQGACVGANGQKDAAGAITAATVSVMLNMNGNCTPPANAGPGGGPSPSPGGFPGGGNGGGNGAGANLANVRGKVTAVSGTTITVQPQTGDPVTVLAPSTARFTRLVTSTSARLATGECVTVTGQRESSGTVKARNILISAPTANGCVRAGGAGGGGGGGRPSASPGGQSA
jgi:Domain of unknown function (DUF5666)